MTLRNVAFSKNQARREREANELNSIKKASIPIFLIEYKHVEETTYNEWVEANSEDEALEIVKDNPNFSNTKGVQGIEIKDFRILERS